MEVDYLQDFKNVSTDLVCEVSTIQELVKTNLNGDKTILSTLMTFK